MRTRYEKRVKMVMSGSTFEILVGEVVKSIDPNCIIKYNLKFYNPSTGRDIECDVLVITENGLFCIECKNYNRALYCDNDYQKWKFISSGKPGYVVNPCLNNLKHIRLIKGLLRKNKLPVYDFENIVCVPDSCKVYNNTGEVLRLSELHKVIGRNIGIKNKLKIENVSRHIDALRK